MNEYHTVVVQLLPCRIKFRAVLGVGWSRKGTQFVDCGTVDIVVCAVVKGEDGLAHGAAGDLLAT